MSSLFKVLTAERRNRLLRELMRTVPPRQLVPFWSAIFFTFAMMGFVVDLFARGRLQLPQLVLVLISSGLLGGVVVYGEINQRRRLIVVAVLAYVLLVRILGRVFPLQQTPDPLRLTLDAGGMLVSVIVAYSFFCSSSAARPRGTFARRLRSPWHATSIACWCQWSPPHTASANSSASRSRAATSAAIWSMSSATMQAGSATWQTCRGHGVGAGVVMAMFKSAVRMRLMRAGSLANLLGDVNRALIPLKESNMFVTAACVRSVGRDTLECAVAGPLPIVRIRGGVPEEVTTPQLAVGMFDAVDFQASTVECRCGDLLVLMTDGITEVFDNERQELGSEHAKQLAAAHSTQPLAEIAEHLVAAARAHGAQLDEHVFAPCHMNYQLLGNSVPHLHVHLVPRYLDDPAPGRPLPWEPKPVAQPEYARQVQLLTDVAKTTGSLHDR